MCDWGTNAVVRLAYPIPVSGRTEIAVDACLAPLVQLLNNHGVHTTGCCCGHWRGDGSVLFEQDGEQLDLKLPGMCPKVSLLDFPANVERDGNGLPVRHAEAVYRAALALAEWQNEVLDMGATYMTASDCEMAVLRVLGAYQAALKGRA
jgi:hypothetical protein